MPALSRSLAQWRCRPAISRRAARRAWTPWLRCATNRSACEAAAGSCDIVRCLTRRARCGSAGRKHDPFKQAPAVPPADTQPTGGLLRGFPVAHRLARPPIDHGGFVFVSKLPIHGIGHDAAQRAAEGRSPPYAAPSSTPQRSTATAGTFGSGVTPYVGIGGERKSS